ncbi:glycosyltransferase family 2 protein [Fulvimarina endophytica]|nr:glycosyltransferase family 2 protein [Fulvimarina endophytica]
MADLAGANISRPAMDKHRFAVGLTVFRPDRSLFDTLLETVRGQAGHVFVVVDGPSGEAIEAEHLDVLRDTQNVTVLALLANAGIAAGLNRLAEAAGTAGFERILFFDQDSTVDPSLPARLSSALDRLAERGEPVAAVGARPVAAAGSDTRAPRYRPRGEPVAGLSAVEFAIVSGLMVDLKAFRAIGPFAETLRMDGVDLEWCFRAWSRGYAIFVDPEAVLEHRVGTGVVRLGPLAFPRQREDRMLNYVRSQAICLRLAHVPLRWKMRTLLYVPVQCAVFALRSPRPVRTLSRLVRAAMKGLLITLSRPLLP